MGQNPPGYTGGFVDTKQTSQLFALRLVRLIIAFSVRISRTLPTFTCSRHFFFKDGGGQGQVRSSSHNSLLSYQTAPDRVAYPSAFSVLLIPGST
jgi:hypothetical protein